MGYVKFFSYRCSFILFFLLIFFDSSAHAATTPGPDGGGYYTGRTDYDWVEISTTGTAVDLFDDDVSDPVAFPAGFDFTFYETPFSTFYIQSNGLISFFENDQNAEVIDGDNYCTLPSASPPKNFIALMWDDLDPLYNIDGAVLYQFFEQNCPYRDYSGQCVVVEFLDIQLSGGDDDPDYYPPASTFEAILFDNNHIIVQFKSSELGSSWGNESTTGIEGDNVAQDHGLSFACNSAGSLFSGLAVEFSDNSAISFKNSFYWPMFLPAITGNSAVP